MHNQMCITCSGTPVHLTDNSQCLKRHHPEKVVPLFSAIPPPLIRETCDWWSVGVLTNDKSRLLLELCDWLFSPPPRPHVSVMKRDVKAVISAGKTTVSRSVWLIVSIFMLVFSLTKRENVRVCGSSFPKTSCLQNVPTCLQDERRHFGNWSSAAGLEVSVFRETESSSLRDRLEVRMKWGNDNKRLLFLWLEG